MSNRIDLILNGARDRQGYTRLDPIQCDRILSEIDALRARAEKAEADAERLARALKRQEFEDNCWCSPEWKEHRVSDYGRKHGLDCIVAREALAAHKAKEQP